jgi:hypothetical protein
MGKDDGCPDPEAHHHGHRPSVPLWMISTEGKPAFMYDRFFLLIDEYGQGEAT